MPEKSHDSPALQGALVTGLQRLSALIAMQAPAEAATTGASHAGTSAGVGGGKQSLSQLACAQVFIASSRALVGAPSQSAGSAALPVKQSRQKVSPLQAASS